MNKLDYDLFSIMTSRAYAKINLGLRILGKRQDGYHNIETVFHRVNIFDTLTFEPSSSIIVECNQENIPTDETNLCVKAAIALQSRHNIREGVRIILDKKIPLGAGLGGGSSDAAETLKSLVKFWNITISIKELHYIATTLGSDVPYFLQDSSAYATGRGEILEYFELDIPYWIVVVYPNIHISTAWAYQNVHPRRGESPAPLKSVILDHINQPYLLMNLVQNDFEQLALRAHQQIAHIKQALYIAGAEFAHLSGSGSALYGLFSNELFVHDVVKEMGQRYPVFVTPPHFKSPSE